MNEFQGIIAAGRNNSFDPSFMKKIENNFIELLVILNNQEYPVSRLNVIPVVKQSVIRRFDQAASAFRRGDINYLRNMCLFGFRLREFRFSRKVQIKYASLVHFTVQDNFSA
ncbi:hypothetical protein D3C81_1822000 [compost metagenome]